MSVLIFQYAPFLLSTDSHCDNDNHHYCCDADANEMVSLGDTAISLHILQPPNANLGGGVFWKVKTQSAKIWLNFNGGGGGGWEGVLERNSRVGVF